MNAIVERRVFLGSAAALGAGLAVVGQGTRLLAERQAVTTQAPAVAKDWAITHITDEAARIARALQSQPRPEHILALAANLRLFAGYAKEHRVDERFGDAMAELIARRGREAVLADAAGEPSAAHLRQMLEAAGVRPHAEKVSTATYERQLDAILQKTALSTILKDGVRTLEAAYVDQERKHGSVHAHVRRIQNADLEQAFRCAYFSQQCDYYSSQASFYCAVAYFLPPTALICAAMGLSAAGYCGVGVYYGC